MIVLIYSLQVKECDMKSIDQRTKNLDELAAMPPINQQQSEKKKKNSLGIVKEKEEQEKLSAREEEEEDREEAEQGGEGEPQASTTKTKEGNIDNMKTAKLSLKRSDPIERKDTLTLK